jgi:hypothetical protein
MQWCFWQRPSKICMYQLQSSYCSDCEHTIWWAAKLIMFSSNAGIPSVECFYPSIVQTLVSEIDFTTAASSHCNKPKFFFNLHWYSEHFFGISRLSHILFLSHESSLLSHTWYEILLQPKNNKSMPIRKWEIHTQGKKI